MNYAELDSFYRQIVGTVRAGGFPCAITSGMACVNYGVVETTNDCDILCGTDGARGLLTTLQEVRVDGEGASYRGTMSAPLDTRWLRGGWTAHFVWRSARAEAYLDVFGVPPRGTGDWASEVRDLYAGRHTVAEMKRTNRERDWPYATALGAQLLAAGDARGWLHIFDLDVLEAFADRIPRSDSLLALRPVLRLLGDARLKQALHVEREFWFELDRQRLSIYQRAVRPYASAVRKDPMATRIPLSAQHAVRVEWAEKLLPTNPIHDHGVDAMIADARGELLKLFEPSLLQWLPDVRENFQALEKRGHD